MEDRQVMYYLINKNDYLINDVVKELYKDQITQSHYISIVQKALKKSLFIENSEDKEYDRYWKKHLTTKSMFEYFTMQNRLVSQFFSRKKEYRTEVVDRCKRYLKELDEADEKENSYLYYYSLFELDDLFVKENFISKKTVDTSIIKKELKINDEQISQTLYSLIDKYYMEYLVQKQKEKQNPITFDKYIDSMNCGTYSKCVKEIAQKKHEEMMFELINSDEENDEMIREINDKKVKEEMENLSVNTSDINQTPPVAECKEEGGQLWLF